MRNTNGSLIGIFVIAVTFLTVVTVCTLGPFNKKTTSANTQKEVVAVNFGWVKTISQPILVTTTNGVSTGFKQVKFGAGDGPVHTALFSQSNITCWYRMDWEIGDEILVVTIPGTVGDIPTPTFVAIDYRSKKPAVEFTR